MIKRKNIALCILFSILTCGIYYLFWFVSIANDVNKLDEDKGNRELSGGMVLLFTILTCGIYGIYWAYKTGERIDGIKNRRRIPTSNKTGITYLFLQLIPSIVSMIHSATVLTRSISFDKFWNMSFNEISPIDDTISEVITLLSTVLIIILYCLMQNEINNLIDYRKRDGYNGET